MLEKDDKLCIAINNKAIYLVMINYVTKSPKMLITRVIFCIV
jgi:hypothetical protein